MFKRVFEDIKVFFKGFVELFKYNLIEYFEFEFREFENVFVFIFMGEFVGILSLLMILVIRFFLYMICELYVM